MILLFINILELFQVPMKLKSKKCVSNNLKTMKCVHLSAEFKVFSFYSVGRLSHLQHLSQLSLLSVAEYLLEYFESMGWTRQNLKFKEEWNGGTSIKNDPLA